MKPTSSLKLKRTSSKFISCMNAFVIFWGEVELLYLGHGIGSVLNSSDADVMLAGKWLYQ
jgi:hypothetical protein